MITKKSHLNRSPKTSKFVESTLRQIAVINWTMVGIFSLLLFENMSICVKWWTKEKSLPLIKQLNTNKFIMRERERERERETKRAWTANTSFSYPAQAKAILTLLSNSPYA